MSDLEAEHWLDQLKRQEPDRTEYGFAFYHHPTLLKETQLGKIRARHDNHIKQDTPANMTFPIWDYQLMKWPEQLLADKDALSQRIQALDVDGDDAEDTEDMDQSVDDFEDDPIIDFNRGRHPKWWRAISSSTLNPNFAPEREVYNRAPLDDRDADHELRKVFEGLRADFRQFRSLPRVPTSSRHGFGYYPGLLMSMNDRCFVFFDPYSAFTWFEEYHSDLAWAWVVDADFEDADLAATTNGTTEQYRGYLRVMLTELTGNFAEAMFLQCPPPSLQRLWDTARQTDHRAFVSIDAE